MTWWVVRHYIGPDTLYSVIDREGLDSFRAALGDNDTIHNVSDDNEGDHDYLIVFTDSVDRARRGGLL